MMCLLIALSLAAMNIKDYEIDFVCYSTDDGKEKCDSLEQTVTEGAPELGLRIGSFVKATPTTVSTCLDNLESYPIWVWLTESTKGEGQDVFELGKVKKNHVIAFEYYSDSVASSLENRLKSLARWAHVKSGMFASQGGTEEAAKNFLAHNAIAAQPGVTAHLRVTQGSADGKSQIDCLFAKGCSFDLKTLVRVQAAVLRSCTIMGDQLIASYVMADWATWTQMYTQASVSTTSAALLVESPSLVSTVTFESDAWVIRYKDDIPAPASVPKDVVGAGGQFSIVQVAEPDTKLELTLNAQTTSEPQNTIAGGLNFSIQTDRDVMLGFSPNADQPEETGAAPTVAVTFGDGWDSVDLNDKKFIFEGRTVDCITVNNQPASATVLKESIANRSSGPSEPEDDPPNLGLIIGCTVAAVVVVAAIIVGVVLFLKCRNKGQVSALDGQEK